MVPISVGVQKTQYSGVVNSKSPTSVNQLLNSQSSRPPIPVLRYHGLSSNGNSNVVTPENFDNQMLALKNNGYSTITMQQYIDYMWNGVSLPDRSVLITFDDGIKSSYANGDPVLKKYGFKASMFIITKRSLIQSSSYYLNKSEAQTMKNSGRWDIEVHARDEGHGNVQINSAGNTAPFFANKKWLVGQNRLETDDEYRLRIRNELVNAKNDILTMLGISPTAFSYPQGNTGQSQNFPLAEQYLNEEVKKAYSNAAFLQWDFPYVGYSQNYPNTGSFKFRRITIDSGTNTSDLINFLEKGRIKVLPFTDDFSTNKGWRALWGNFSFSQNNMLLMPKGTGLSNFVYLDGAYPWNEYSYTVKVNSSNARILTLAARFKDELNYVSVKFYKDNVRIEQTLNGNTSLLATAPITLPEQNFEIGVAVDGGNVEGSLNGQKVVSSSQLNAALSMGGPGIKVVHYTSNSQVSLKQVDVKLLTVTPIPTSAKSIPVLLYHGLGSTVDPYVVTPENFESHMKALRENGYSTITMQQYIDYMWNSKSLPDKSVLITFDDGIKSSYINGDTILQKYGFNAAMFLMTGRSLNGSSSYYLNKSDAQAMLNSGRWSINAHCREEGHSVMQIDSAGNKGHFFTNKKWLMSPGRLETTSEYVLRVRNELTSAKSDIVTILGVSPLAFAYPFGDIGYKTQTKNFPGADQYLSQEIKTYFPFAAFRQWDFPYVGYTQNYPDTGPLFRRNNIYSYTTTNQVIDFLNKGRYKELPYVDDFSTDKGWRVLWGSLSLSTNNMLLKPAGSGVSNYIYLDGSYPWTNYSYSTKVVSSNASNITLVARFKDELNYISAKYYNNLVRIEKTVNGTTSTLIQAAVTLPQQNFQIGINVNGNKVESSLNGQIVTSYTGLESSFTKGGVGIRVLHPSSSSAVSISQINVSSL